jgi:hypothetical protein
VPALAYNGMTSCLICVSCHYGTGRPQVEDGGDDPQMWRVAANILNKQSLSGDK